MLGGTTELVQHYRLVHSLIDGALFTCGAVPCNQTGCYRTFQYTWSLKRHFNSRHSELFDCNQIHRISNDDEAGNISDPESDHNSEQGLDVPYGIGIELDDIRVKCAQLVCNLRSSSRITTSTVHLVTKVATDLFTDILDYIRSKTTSVIASLGVDPQNEPKVKDLFDDLKELESPFKDVDTDYKFVQFLKNSQKFVQPVSVPLGVEYVQKTNSATGAVEQNPVQKTFQYVPLKMVLKLVLESPGFLDVVFKHHRHQNDSGLLKDFQDGEYCRNNEFFTQHVIRILFPHVNPPGLDKGIAL